MLQNQQTGITVGAIMSQPPLTVGSDSDLREARFQLREHGVHHLFVEDRGRIVGLLSLDSDVCDPGGIEVALGDWKLLAQGRRHGGALGLVFRQQLKPGPGKTTVKGHDTMRWAVGPLDCTDLPYESIDSVRRPASLGRQLSNRVKRAIEKRQGINEDELFQWTRGGGLPDQRAVR